MRRTRGNPNTTGWRNLRTLAVAAALGLFAAACGSDQVTTESANKPPISGPQLAAATPSNGAGACMGDDAVTWNTRVDGVSSTSDPALVLNCTANDISIALATATSFNGQAIDPNDPPTCTQGQTITLGLTAQLQDNAKSERQDIGIWVATDGGAAQYGTCNQYNLPTDPTLPAGVVNSDGDQCGGMTSGTNTTVDLGTITVPCTPDANSQLHIGACLSWKIPGAGGDDQTCPDNSDGSSGTSGAFTGTSASGEATDFRAGTLMSNKSKCNCDGFTIPIQVQQQAHLEVKKVCVGTSTGTFDLEIDNSGNDDYYKQNDAACGGTTGSQLVGAGTSLNPGATHSVSESDFTASEFTSTLACTKGGSPFIASEAYTANTDRSFTVNPNDVIVCTFTNSLKPALKVAKVTDPTTDGGKFDFTIAGTGYDNGGAGYGNGQNTGFIVMDPGAKAVSEAAHTGTTLSNYVSDLSCSKTVSSNTGTSGSVTLAYGDAVTCTFTNHRKPTLEVKKTLSPTDDPGKFDFTVAGTGYNNGGAGFGNGGTTGTLVTTTGSKVISEAAHTGTTLTDYTSTLACTNNGSPMTVNPNTGTSGTLSLAYGDNVVCTFTNTRKVGTIEVKKVWVGEGGQTTLQIGTSSGGTQVATQQTGAAGATPLTTGAKAVNTGTYWVSETGGLTNYVSALACTSDGSPISVGSNTNTGGSVAVANNAAVVCTFTNSRKPELEVKKVLDPTTDAGKFDFTVDGTGYDNSGNGYGHNGTTGTIVFSTEKTVSFSEAAHTGTTLSNYVSELSCTKSTTTNTNTAGSVALAYGDKVVCTFTNHRKPELKVAKVTDPTTDGGKFDFTIAGTGYDNTGAGYGNGQNTGFILMSIGAKAISEAAHTGTTLSEYVSELSCTKTVSSNTGTSGSVTLAYGDQVTCTFTNHRKARLTVDKVVIGGGPQLFDFSLTGGITFQLADATTPYTTGWALTPGTKRVCELNLAVAWASSATVDGSPATLINPDAPSDNGNRCVDVTVAYGSDRTVVFTNTPPPGGGTRTIGYWKNWSSCAQSNGKQYEKALAPGGAGLQATLDGNLAAIVPVGTIASLNCLQAVNLLSKNAIDGTKWAGDPIYNMVAQLVGAKLNVAAGAGTCSALTTALTDAQTLLLAISFNGLGSYKSTLTAQQAAQANTLNGILGSYNEGTLGGGCPGHI